MFYYLTASILILSLPSAISAIKCWNCKLEFEIATSDAINTTNSNCGESDKDGNTCSSSLSIDLQYKNGTATFDHSSNQDLIFSNAKKMMVITTSIRFSEDSPTTLVDLMNTDGNALETDANNIISTIDTWEIDKLRTELLNHLYDSLEAVSNLTCSNGKGEMIPCANGSCQLIASDTRILRQKCVPQSEEINSYGLLVKSTTIEELVTAETIIYSCNKPMCNGVETGQKVRNLLHKYKLVTTNQFVTPPPSTTTTTTTPKPSNNKAHSMMDTAAWTIFLILSSFLTMVSM